MPFFHGIKVNELAAGVRALQSVATAVIGLVATADDADAAAFPLDRPALVTDIRAALAKAGTTGTLSHVLAAITDQASPVIVVVRVAEGIDADDTETNVIGGVTGGQFTGIEALLGAEAALGVRPRILGAPGLDTQAVTDALVTAAQKLRGFVYAAAQGTDAAAAVTYRGNFGARELMLIWPDFGGTDVFPGDAVARAMGLRARIDEETGWHKTLSNVAINGVTGLTKDVHFDLQDASTTAGVLNAGHVTTMARMNGYRFWGNRTCADDAAWAFESTVRTSQALQDTIAQGLVWAIDKPLNPHLVRDISETINAEFRRLQGEGRLIGAEVLPLDMAANTSASLGAGQLALDYEFTVPAPLEGLTLGHRVSDRFYATLGDQLNRI